MLSASSAPIVVAVSTFGIARAGIIPASDVLRAGCDLQQFGGAWIHLGETLAHAIGIDYFVGSPGAAHHEGSRVLGVCGVDVPQDGSQPLATCGHGVAPGGPRWSRALSTGMLRHQKRAGKAPECTALIR